MDSTITTVTIQRLFLTLVTTFILLSPNALSRQVEQPSIFGVKIGMLRTDVDALQGKMGRIPHTAGAWVDYFSGPDFVECLRDGPFVRFDQRSRAVAIRGEVLSIGSQVLMHDESTLDEMYDVLGRPSAVITLQRIKWNYYLYSNLGLAVGVPMDARKGPNGKDQELKLMTFQLVADPDSLTPSSMWP